MCCCYSLQTYGYQTLSSDASNAHCSQIRSLELVSICYIHVTYGKRENKHGGNWNKNAVCIDTDGLSEKINFAETKDVREANLLQTTGPAYAVGTSTFQLTTLNNVNVSNSEWLAYLPSYKFCAFFLQWCLFSSLCEIIFQTVPIISLPSCHCCLYVTCYVHLCEARSTFLANDQQVRDVGPTVYSMMLQNVSHHQHYIFVALNSISH